MLPKLVRLFAYRFLECQIILLVSVVSENPQQHEEQVNEVKV